MVVRALWQEILEEEMRDAIIVDLDGTLADVRPVRHYVTGKKRNFEKFHEYACTEAKPNGYVGDLIDRYYAGADILLVTGRHEKWRTKTDVWLNKHDIRYDWMWMRPNDDFRKDVELKWQIYNDRIAARYNVLFAVDDNPRIVALWRSLDIPVFVVPGWDDEDGSAPQNEV